MRQTRSWAPLLMLFIGAYFGLSAFLLSQDLPSDYGIDLQLADAGRSKFMAGNSEIVGSATNQTGDEVFHRLVGAGFGQPFAWKLTIVNDQVVNAGSTAGGKIYVHGGLASLIGQDQGLWAAVLSHEIAHTGRRHQVAVYMRRLYIQKTIQYYRARAAAGDKSANWGLIAFTTSSAIALKKMERDQEHDADQQGMLIMARAGYHPDNVFALHHLLLMKTGEQSKFSAFFSDHPRWETRDQRSDKVYGDAVTEFNRLWTDPVTSPGGAPPVVAFLGEPEAKTNKQDGTVDVSVPVYCRNTLDKVDLVLVFNKDNHPVTAADSEYASQDGSLAFRKKTDCLETGTIPVVLRVPASAVSTHDRSLKAAAYVESNGETIAGSKPFDVHFSSFKRTAMSSTQVASKPVIPTNALDVSKARPQNGEGEANSLETAMIMHGAIQTSRVPSSQEGSTLTIASTPEGGDIFVDSAGLGKTPATLKVKSGKHSLQIVKDGYLDWVQDVSVDMGKTASIAADLNPKTSVRTVVPVSHPAQVEIAVADSSSVTNPPSSISSTELTKLQVQGNSSVAPVQVLENSKTAAMATRSDGVGGIGVAAINGAYGIIIIDLILNGPAMEAGLKIGDTVIGIDDKSVKTTQMMDTVTQHRAPGSMIKVSYVRNGTAGETTVSVGDRFTLKSQL